MSRRLRVLRLGVRVERDLDRTAEIRAYERDDLGSWEDTFAAVARGDEVFVTARFFVEYAGWTERSLGATHSWHTLPTREDATAGLVRLADVVYDEGWPTELGDMRIAGFDLTRADLQPDEAVIEVAVARITVSAPAGSFWQIVRG